MDQLRVGARDQLCSVLWAGPSCSLLPTGSRGTHVPRHESPARDPPPSARLWVSGKRRLPQLPGHAALPSGRSLPKSAPAFLLPLSREGI